MASSALMAPTPPAVLSAVLFLVAFAIQLGVWRTEVAIDSPIWTPAVEMVYHGTSISGSDPTRNYPGTPIVLTAGAIMHLGASSQGALEIALALLSALCLTAVAFLLKLLRPSSSWWLASFAFLAMNTFALNATPASAIILLLIPVLLVSTLYAVANPQSIRAGLMLGGIGGIACATRLDISACVFVFALAFISWTTRAWKTVGVVALTGLLFFAALDIYLWPDPRAHITDILSFVRMLAHDVVGNPPFVGILSQASFAILAIIFFLFLLARRSRISVQSSFFVWLLGLTVLITTGLLTSHYHPIWYFYPLFTAWMIFLPMLIVDIFTAMPLVILKERPWLITSTMFLPAIAQAFVFTICLLKY